MKYLGSKPNDDLQIKEKVIFIVDLQKEKTKQKKKKHILFGIFLLNAVELCQV